MNSVDISCKGVPYEKWVNKLVDYIQKVLHYMNIDEWELSVVLCNNDFIKNLNAIYRSKNEVTDVLSFPQNQPGITWEMVHAGDIIISTSKVKDNAVRFNVLYEEELKRVVIHGILHLTGMDHETNDPAERMLRKQEKILQTVGGERLF